jgi:NAD(P)-dependent dehydrogenase (short-subunit alcohol dehydrogenase family)
MAPNDPHERLRALTQMLEEIAADRGILDVLSVEERTRLLTAAGTVFIPDADARRRRAKDQRRQDKDDRRRRAEELLEETGIRELRRRPVFHSPNVFPPAAPQQLALAPFTEGPQDAERTSSGAAGDRHCYVCKRSFRVLHHFYDQLCPPCAELNFAKRTETADLGGRTALVTGGRVKIGHHAGFEASSRRCPSDRHDEVSPGTRRAASRGEVDFEDWSERLEIFGLDLRHTPSVEAFCAHLTATRDRLDYVINNACQTVRRPPEFYRHMMELESASVSSARTRGPSTRVRVRRCVLGPDCSPATGNCRRGSGRGALPPRSSARRRLRRRPCHSFGSSPMTGGTTTPPSRTGQLDGDLQQVDQRGRNSWRLMLDEVSSVELLETQLVNAVAPFVLNARLKHLMVRAPGRDQHVVNVSAVEGQFYRRFKTTRHPHTNMAKAALNMMTRTSAAEYAADGIHMNSVDTGWVTDEDPLEVAGGRRPSTGFPPAARHRRRRGADPRPDHRRCEHRRARVGALPEGLPADRLVTRRQGPRRVPVSADAVASAPLFRLELVVARRRRAPRSRVTCGRGGDGPVRARRSRGDDHLQQARGAQHDQR